MGHLILSRKELYVLVRKKVRTLSDILKDMRESYIHWKDMYFNGCSDPSWEDGTNLNLTRNHIIYYRNEIEELLGDNFVAYPDEYYWPVPNKVPETYMAVDRKLACRSKVLEATPKPFEVNW